MQYYDVTEVVYAGDQWTPRIERTIPAYMQEKAAELLKSDNPVLQVARILVQSEENYELANTMRRDQVDRSKNELAKNIRALVNGPPRLTWAERLSGKSSRISE